MLNISEMRFYADLQKPIVTQGDAGEPSKTWKHVCSAWVSMVPLTTDESIRGERKFATTTYRIAMRQGDNRPAPNWRLVVEGKTLEIDSPANDPTGRGEVWELEAVEVVEAVA